MTKQVDLTTLGVEDVSYFLQFAPRGALDTARAALRNEVAELERKQRYLAILDTYFDGQAEPSPPKTDAPIPAPAQTVDDGIKEQGHTSNELKSPRKNIVEERNQAIRQQNLDNNNWRYRTHYEVALEKAGLVNRGENFREIVRQILRQARNKGVLIERAVYVITSLGVVHPTYMLGLPEYEYAENKEKYDKKLEALVKEMGMFMTEGEAREAKKTQKDTNQLSFADN